MAKESATLLLIIYFGPLLKFCFDFIGVIDTRKLSICKLHMSDLSNRPIARKNKIHED